MWYDEQLRRPIAYCEVCGGEIYGEGGCLRCQRRRVAADNALRPVQGEQHPLGPSTGR